MEKFTIDDLKIIKYGHGGSRIYLENKNDDKELLCDTYEPEEIRDIVFEAIKEKFHQFKDKL
jgi:hypothetical protein